MGLQPDVPTEADLVAGLRWPGCYDCCAHGHSKSLSSPLQKVTVIMGDFRKCSREKGIYGVISLPIVDEVFELWADVHHLGALSAWRYVTTFRRPLIVVTRGQDSNRDQIGVLIIDGPMTCRVSPNE